MFKLKITKADKLFSYFIRHRDNSTCQRCHKWYEMPTTALHCSHFHGRGKKSVRFDPENAMAACYGCHRWLTANPHEHRALWFKRLGEKAYDRLTLRANTPQKVDEKMVCLWLESELKRMGVDPKTGRKD